MNCKKIDHRGKEFDRNGDKQTEFKRLITQAIWEIEDEQLLKTIYQFLVGFVG